MPLPLTSGAGLWGLVQEEEQDDGGYVGMTLQQFTEGREDRRRMLERHGLWDTKKSTPENKKRLSEGLKQHYDAERARYDATPPDVNLAVLHELQRGRKLGARKPAAASGAASANPRGRKRNHDGEGTDMEPIDAHGLKQRSQGTAGGGALGPHRDNHE